MKTRIKFFMSFALATSLLSACTNEEKKDASPPDNSILSDKEAVPEPSGLIRLQERPAFPVDEKGRPFAMTDDRMDRNLVDGKPVRIQEPEPSK